MTALDFSSSPGNVHDLDHAPAFFSGNVGSLSRVLSQVTEVRTTEEERGSITLQTVVYRMLEGGHSWPQPPF
jgi:hypothetical protein